MDQKDKQRLDIHILYNPFPQAFTFLWDNFKYTIPANGQLPAVYGVAVHGANRLVEMIIQLKHGYPKVLDRQLRMQYLKEVVPTIDAGEIIGDPLKIEEVKSGEGLSEEVVPVPQNVPTTLGEGFTNEDDEEIDLNPVALNDSLVPSEDELRREALADSLPVHAREEELRLMERKPLQDVAKSLGIKGNQTSEELIKQILEKENK